MDGSDDLALVEAAKGGDTGALEKLLERHQDRVYRFAMKMCRHPEDAEDIVQDTLLSAAKSIGGFRGGSSLSTWLYTIARSACIKKRRKSKFAPEQEHSLEQDASAEARALAHPGQPPDEAAHAKEIQTALDGAIHTLDEDQREVLVLRDVEGLKATEVADVLGISVAAVKSRLHRARVRVRDLVAPTLGIAPPAAPDVGCPDVLTMYSKNLEGEISADLCAEMERHLEGCDTCRASCDSLKQTLSFCSRMPAARVPASVQDSVKAALRDLLA